MAFMRGQETSVSVTFFFRDTCDVDVALDLKISRFGHMFPECTNAGGVIIRFCGEFWPHKNVHFYPFLLNVPGKHRSYLENRLFPSPINGTNIDLGTCE